MDISPSLETSPCLKGTLPVEEGMTLGDVMGFATQRHGDALCQWKWGVSLVNVINKHNDAVIAAMLAAQEEAEQARRRRWWRRKLP